MAVAPIFDKVLLSEFKTVSAMVSIYCKAHHHNVAGGTCQSCQEFKDYAHMRLDRCPYGQKKPNCNNCPVHCYKPNMKIKARDIMLFAGPRMLLLHPVMAIKHLFCSRKVVSKKPAGNNSNRHRRMQNHSVKGG